MKDKEDLIKCYLFRLIFLGTPCHFSVKVIPQSKFYERIGKKSSSLKISLRLHYQTLRNGLLSYDSPVKIQMKRIKPCIKMHLTAKCGHKTWFCVLLSYAVHGKFSEESL